MTTRKKYSREFKLDAINLVREQGYSQAEAGAVWASIPICWADGFRNIRPTHSRRFAATVA